MLSKTFSPSILITSGGTREMIDSARMITNRSTGKLGSLLADVFIARGAQVTYLYANHAIQPNFKPEQSIRIKTSSELSRKVVELSKTQKFDAVIHLMAVSDFTPIGYSSEDDIINDILSINPSDFAKMTKDELCSVFRKSRKPLEDGKMSSKQKNLSLFFENTEKVIDQIRSFWPETVLVGFKLLANSSQEKLISASKFVMDNAHCDFVVANDQSNISFSQNRHTAIIMDKSGDIQQLNSKEEIAIKVAEKVCHVLRSRAV